MTAETHESASGRIWILHLLWPCLGVLALLLDRPAEGKHDLAELLISLLALVFGVWVFWRHGGGRITAAGLFSLTMAALVGFAGLWWLGQPGLVTNGVYLATSVGFWLNYSMYMLFWRSFRIQAVGTPPRVSRSVTTWGIWCGLIIAALSIISSLSGLKIGLTVNGEAAFAGLALLATSLMLHRAQRAQPLRRLALAGVVVLIYEQTVFSGYGRLILVALALVPVILLSDRVHGRMLKIGILAGATPVLALFVYAREQSRWDYMVTR